MSGTPSGGLKACATNKRKYGKDFYIKIGRKGGQNGHTGGFSDRELASIAGRKGGRISKRVKRLPAVKDWPLNYEQVNNNDDKLFEPSLSFHQKLRKAINRNKDYTSD